MGHIGGNWVKQAVNLPTQEVVHGGRTALVGNVVVLRRAPLDLEQLAKQMVGRPNARRAIAHRLGFGSSDVLLKGLERRLAPHQQGHRRFDQHAHVNEIIDRIKRHAAPRGGGIHMHRGMAHQQGVAISDLLRHILCAHQATGSGPVFNHHGLPKRLRQVRRNHARHRIHQAAGRELRHQPDRATCWPGRALGAHQGRGGDQGCSGAKQ